MVYQSLEQIFKDGKRIVDDFTDADLSLLDLSGISSDSWKGATFQNTNFRGTNIKFNPKDLKELNIYGYGFYDFLAAHLDYKYQNISGCNFENCDLSYLKEEDFYNVIFSNCNFYHTGLNIDFTNEDIFKKGVYAIYREGIYDGFLLSGVILPKSYHAKNYTYWDSISLNIEFIKNNPNIKVSSGKLLEVIKGSLQDIDTKLYSMKDYEQKVMKIQKLLEYDKEGLLKRIYQDMKPYFQDARDEALFFKGEINFPCFKELDLTYLSPKLLLQFSFYNCDISLLKLPVGFKELLAQYEKESKVTNFIDHYTSKLENLQVPVTMHDWDNQRETRLLSSPITFQTNLYLELKRICNMDCIFCRNNGLDSQAYNYSNIVNNLKEIYPHLNNIVIGGGEPTLLLQDLKTLKKDIAEEDNDTNFQIITNGTLSIDEYLKMKEDYTLYISRHAIDDKENRAIFGDNNHILLSAAELSVIPDYDDVLCCTCFKGGIDSKDKMIEYLKFAKDIGFSNVLFQTLHQEENFGNSSIGKIETIDGTVISSTLGYLERVGFHISKPIYSTSGYELHLASHAKIDLNISFKEYGNPEYIEQKWHQSTKRCFDLSMAPNGDIYESWNQQQKPVKIKRKN